MQPERDLPQSDPSAASSVIDLGRRSGIIRKLLTLSAGTIALFLVLLYMRDGRQVSRAEEWARRYLESVQAVPVHDGSLPLNLAPPEAGGAHPSVVGVSWLDREQARVLRNHKGPVIVAQTNPIPLILSENGHIVIVFEGGQWRTEWLARADYLSRMQAQDQLIRQLSQQAPPAGP